MCPGFSADCLETLEEIAIQNSETFVEAGGGSLEYIPCLNDDDDHLNVLAALIARNAAGWPETLPNYDAEETARGHKLSRDRALAMGAAQ